MADDERTATAVVFPGMGPTRFADVGRFLVVNPFARRLTQTATEELGYDLVERFRTQDADYSEAAQVAFLVSCLALAQWAEDELGMAPDVCTGPSFGEKAATAYVGSLPVPDVVRMTARMARCLEEYFAHEHRDVVTHSFVRTPGERLAEILAELTDRGEWYDISCHVDDDFYMVSLRERNLDWLQRRLRGAGGLPLYTMRPPMHASAFEPLRRKAAVEVFGDLRFADPQLPLVADQDGRVLTTAADVHTMLLDSFVRPMRWPDVVAAMKRMGVGTVYVCGPDSLFGRVGATTRNFEVVSVNPRLAMQPRRRGAVVGG
jgi:[acyl-carrier-protein] S-malonyltransferase